MKKSKPPAQVVTMKPLVLKGVSTAVGPDKKRVFSEDEWSKLNTESTITLRGRIARGQLLIRLLNSPEMLNVTPSEADMLSSNLNYQIEAIRSIIDNRPKE